MAAAIMSADEGKSRRLTAEDRKLWGHFTRSVARRGGRGVRAAAPTVASSRAKLPPQVRPPARVAAAAARTAPGPEPFDRRLKQRLARGTEPLDDRIDLHGKTQSEAHAALLSFLRQAQRHGARFVLAITGKGGPPPADWRERGWRTRALPQR